MNLLEPESLYDRIGGDYAVNAAVDSFYEKVLEDSRINPFFEGISMDAQIGKLKSFLKMAFGDRTTYNAERLRAAHAPLVDQGMNDTHIDILIGHMESTLKEQNVPSALIKEAITIINSYRDDVLCR